MRSLLQPTRSSIALFAFLLIFATLGAVSIGEAHTGHGLLCGLLYLIVPGSFFGYLFFRPLPAAYARLLSSPWVWLALLAALGAADQYHFRTAERGPDPLTSSLALELPADALVHGKEPYSVHLVRDAPISPGPGWIVLLTPLTVPRLTGLLGALLLGCATFCIARTSQLSAGAFLLVLLCCPLFESQAANGQDLFAISLACVALCLLLEDAAGSLRLTAILSVAAGLVGTARLPFVAILLIPGLGLWRRDRRAGQLYLVVMPVVALLFDGGFALWAVHAGDWFQPMHIFGRGTAATGHGAQITVALLVSGALLWVLLRMRGCSSDWMLGMWFVLTALFLPEGLKEFKQMAWDLRWEGSSYATFALPLLAAALVLRSRILGGAAFAARVKTERGTAAPWSVGE